MADYIILQIAALAADPRAPSFFDAQRPSQWIGVALAAAAITLLLISTRRRLRQHRQQANMTAQERIAQLKQRQGVRDDMRDLLVELSDLARGTNAQLDTKFVKLELAMDDARKLIQRLEHLIAEAKSLPLAEARIPPADAAPADAAAPCPAPPKADTASPVPERHQRIYELADAGRSPIDIARELSQSVGEIELILALRKT
jgi:hypothetical protein